MRRLIRIACIASVSLFALLLLGMLNNNYSFTQPGRTQLRAQLDSAIDVSTTWLAGQRSVYRNPALMYMVIDMARLSKDARLTELADTYQRSGYVKGIPNPVNAVWARMMDRDAWVPVLDETRVSTEDTNELLWDAYAMAPDRVEISAAQKTNMFSRTKYSWGRRQHQLLALNMYRHFNGGTPEFDTTLNYLAEKVARDQHFDFRMNDSYPQRIAFVLAAARPDLIQSRWVDRLLENRHVDGWWGSCWHGWCKGLFEFRLRDDNAVHATTQGMWALYQLKYRFPGWIDEHYQ